MYCANSICAFDLFAPVVPRYPSSRVSGVTSKSGRRISLFGGGGFSTNKLEKYAPTSARALSAPALSALAPPKIANIARRRFTSSARASTSVASPRARATTDVTRVWRPDRPDVRDAFADKLARARARDASATWTFIVLDGGVRDASSSEDGSREARV